ncbi:MBL fold metallo-hydrolase [Crocinitomix algicola]|uniref:MBL fold metallo-hydrolase n=1 Tax=Crocinitomix algicola TaxID=1740263 RepID=UPI000872569B|nr:MBL fold metallo-hydrolase [Crocinitomix algicola]
MIKVQKFTFNPFQENTYVLYDESGECVIIDPGCYESHERETLSQFIQENNLKPVHLLNTHCHVDHVFGNYFVSQTYNLQLSCHRLDLPTLALVPKSCQMYGIPGYQLSPEPTVFLEEGDVVEFGKSKLKVIFGPGHAPGHIAFYAEEESFVINGDILFKGSFGRYDLPGASFEDLQKTILDKMFMLPEHTVVYCGHGPETTIGQEKLTNPIRTGF